MNDEMMAKYQRLVAKGLDTDDAVKELQQDIRIDNLPDQYIKYKS